MREIERYPWLKRMVLRAYSRPFRVQFGDDMWAAFERSLYRRGGRARAWITIGRDLMLMLISGVLDRWERRRAGRGRGFRGGPEGLRQEVLYALRRIRRAPILAFGIITAFAIGIGANAAMYGIADRLLLSPPPHLEDAERLRIIAVEQYSQFSGRRIFNPVRSYPDMKDWEQARTLAGVAGYDFSVRERTVGSGAAAQRFRTQAVTGDYFAVLGASAVRGRVLQPEDDVVGAADVAVISAGLWQRQYGGAPDVLGRSIDFGDSQHTIVGIMPVGFTGVAMKPVDVWIPIAPYRSRALGAGWNQSRRNHWLVVVARLRPGVTDEQATAELTALHLAPRQEDVAAGRYDGDARATPTSIIPGESPLRDAEVDVARWLTGLSFLLLLLACTNVANLLVARQVRERRDALIRRALGASRLRLAMSVSVEAIMLAGLGAAVALGILQWGGVALRRALLPDLSWETAAGGREALIACAIAILAAAVAGAVPGVRAFRTANPHGLRFSGITRDGRMLRASLVVAQVSLSLILLVCAALFVRSFTQALEEDLGIDPANTYLVQIESSADDETERDRIIRGALATTAGRPGVQAVAAASTFPFFQMNSAALRVEGWDSVPGFVMVHAVAGDYFGALGLSLHAGRQLGAGDIQGAPLVAVINDAMAERVWPRGALGRCLYIGDGNAPCTEIVGVVESARLGGIGGDVQMAYYVPASQQAPAGGLYHALVRFDGPPSAAVVENTRAAIYATDARIRFIETEPVAAVLEYQLRPWRLGASLFTAFGILALSLAAIGLHALLAFDVSHRRRELGIRAALGASGQRLVAQMLRYAVGLAALGIAIGALASTVIARRLEDLLFRTSAYDTMSFMTAALVLLVAAVCASVLPARRAGRADPMDTLRAEY